MKLVELVRSYIRMQRLRIQHTPDPTVGLGSRNLGFPAYRRRIIDPIRSRGIPLLEGAMRREEIRDSIDPEVVVDAVIGGLIYRAATLAEPLGVEEACAFSRRVVGLTCKTIAFSVARGNLDQ